MGYNLILTDPFKIDLKWIHNYISVESKRSANFFIIQIMKKIDFLKSFPFLWKKLEKENYEIYREIIYKKYRIIYRIDWKNIFIISIFHWTKNNF